MYFVWPQKYQNSVSLSSFGCQACSKQVVYGIKVKDFLKTQSSHKEQNLIVSIIDFLFILFCFVFTYSSEKEQKKTYMQAQANEVTEYNLHSTDYWYFAFNGLYCLPLKERTASSQFSVLGSYA